LTGAFTMLLVVISVALVLAILLQSARGAGLGGSIGGSAEQIFGKRRGVDAFLSRLTVALGIAFFLVAVVIGYLQHLPGAG
jgi:preprotein translocase subunit SecG